MNRRVLFICVRNRVRSIYAEYFITKLLKEKNDRLAEKIKTSSAGYYPTNLRDFLDKAHIREPEPFFGTDMSGVVRARLTRKGFPIVDGWRSKALSPQHIAEADLIVAALPSQKEEILQKMPEARGKLFTFREMADFENSILFESFAGLPMDDTFWEYCEEDPSYVSKVIREVEELLSRGLPRILSFLGV